MSENGPNGMEEFFSSLELDRPPASWAPEIKALWWDAKGEWGIAHDCVDSLSTSPAAWVHAYLHRKEGDRWNAAYWYRQANRAFPSLDLKKEFMELVSAMLVK